MAKIYALYKGDKFLDSGTAIHLAKRRGIKVSTLMYYSYPRYARRNKGGDCLCLIEIKEDE